MAIQHVRSYEYAFSLNKQTDFFTPCIDAAINKKRSIRTFAPPTMQPTNVDDRTWVGKGHPFPTFKDRIYKWFQLPSAERSATSLEALYAIAYVLGDVTSTQPNTGTNPNEWQHVIVFQDIQTFKQCLFTAMLSKMGTEFEEKLSGAWLSQFTLRGNREDHVVLSFEGGGRKLESSVASLPTSSEASFFKTLFGSVSFGDSSLPLDDISGEVLSFELTCNQNPIPRPMMGNDPGEEDLLSQVLIGDQTISGNVIIEIEAAARALFVAQTEVGFQLVMKSPDLIDSNQHSITVDLPHVKIASEAWGEDNTTVAYTLAIDEGSVLKSGVEDPITFTIVSDIGNTELLVAA